MSNKKSSYLISTLKLLLKGKTLSSISGAKNSNQYFCVIKNNGIELIEAKKPNLTNKGHSKHRSLHQTIENIERAKKYLESLQGMKK